MPRPKRTTSRTKKGPGDWAHCGCGRFLERSRGQRILRLERRGASGFWLNDFTSVRGLQFQGTKDSFGKLLGLEGWGRRGFRALRNAVWHQELVSRERRVLLRDVGLSKPSFRELLRTSSGAHGGASGIRSCPWWRAWLLSLTESQPGTHLLTAHLRTYARTHVRFLEPVAGSRRPALFQSCMSPAAPPDFLPNIVSRASQHLRTNVEPPSHEHLGCCLRCPASGAAFSKTCNYVKLLTAEAAAPAGTPNPSI